MKTSNHMSGVDYKLGNLGISFQFHANAENFSLFQSLPIGSGTPSPPPPIHWAPQVFFRGTKGPKYAEINPLKMKRRLLYLKAQFVLRSKQFFHLGSKNQSVYAVSGTCHCSQINTKHINTVWAELTVVEC